MIPTYTSKHKPQMITNPPPPPLANARTLIQEGFAAVDQFEVSAVSALFAQWLTTSTSDSFGNATIDVNQARVFLDHMIHKMGLYVEDLIYMRIFVERYMAGTVGMERPTVGLQLLFSAYQSQSLQYDEPLSKAVWTYYSKMSWGQFLDEVMKFSSAMSFDLSVTAQQWNGAAYSLLEPLIIAQEQVTQTQQQQHHVLAEAVKTLGTSSELTATASSMNTSVDQPIQQHQYQTQPLKINANVTVEPDVLGYGHHVPAWN